jgi:hypothetical protein
MITLGSQLRFWVRDWSGNFVDVTRPSTGTWFAAVGRVEKDGGGVDFCVNTVDGTADTLTATFSPDTAAMPLRIGSTQTSGYGTMFDGQIDEVAFWSTYADDTDFAELCAASTNVDVSTLKASPTLHYKINSLDDPTDTTDGVDDSGSLNVAGDGEATLSLVDGP